MTRKEMQDKLIRVFGMEDSRVVWFFQLCEDYDDNEWNNKCLEGMVMALLDIARIQSEME